MAPCVAPSTSSRPAGRRVLALPEGAVQDGTVEAREPDADPVHWLDLGPEPDPEGDRRPPRRWRWWYALLAGLAVAALLLTRNQHTTQSRPLAAQPSESATSATGPVSSRSPTTAGRLPGIHPPPPGLGSPGGSGPGTVSTALEPTL